MVNTRIALERLWTDRATVTAREEVTNPTTRLTDFEEAILLEYLPCKLSFESLRPAGKGTVATAEQSVKLICSSDVEIPAGCKISVTRPNDLERVFVYARSGEAGVFSNHQEIQLEPWKEWAQWQKSGASVIAKS